MLGLYLLTAFFLSLACIGGCVNFCEQVSNCVVVLSLIGFLLILTSSTLAQAMFILYRNAINDTMQSLNVSVSLGTAIFAFTWFAVLCALIACWCFWFGFCCRKNKNLNDRRFWRRDGNRYRRYYSN
jgi:chromate transport protein ChrA